jgi:hypothetical protein
MLHNSCSETSVMFEVVHGKVTMKEIQAYEGHKRFRDECANVSDLRHRGWPSSVPKEERIARVANVMRSNRRQGTHEISPEVGMSALGVHSALH